MPRIVVATLLALTLLSAVGQRASAQGYYPNIADYPPSTSYYGNYPNNYGYRNYGAPQYPARNQYQPPYSYQQPQYRGNYYSGYPQSQGYGYYQPYRQQPYYPMAPRSGNSGFKKVWKPEKWRGRNFGEEFWPGRGSIYEDALPMHGPWDRNWGKAPWNREYEDLWGDEGGPDAWFDFKDPKEGMAWMWEDMLYTPNALGTMPGGWEAPSISVPNPVDVGDEFKNASTDFPGEMRDFADGFTYGDRTMTGSKPKKDGGSFGLGNKKKDGINIQPKVRK